MPYPRLLLASVLSTLLASPLFAAPEGYSLTWSDEFNGSSLDASKWENRAPGVRRGGYNTPSAVSVSNGSLAINTTWNAAQNRYDTGMIGTQNTFQQTYGYFEARINPQTYVGHWSAFWLQSPDIQTASTPPTPATLGTEVDIMEYRSQITSGVQHALHWNGYGSGHQTIAQQVAPAGFAASEWHTFGLLWTDSRYTFYVDGIQTWTTTTAISQRPEYLVLSLEVATPNSGEVSWTGGTINNTPIRTSGAADGILVDYVRVYAPTPLAVIPEPASLSLLALGTLALATTRRRRSNP